MSGWRRTIGATAAVLVVTLLPAGAATAEPAPPVAVVEKPTVSGTPRYGQTLTASPGRWDPSAVTPSYQWLRDGKAVPGRTGRTQRLTERDIGHRVSVRVTARAPDRTDGVSTSTSVAVSAARLESRSRPTISGQRRYRATLTAHPGRWSSSGVSFAYRWFRDGKAIRGKGSTARTRQMTHLDVGHHMSVRVTARKRYHEKTTGPRSATTAVVRHWVDPRRTVTYSVVNDGASASMNVFARQVAETYADARGWRKGATQFQRVSSGGSFTVVLARADRVPRYSSACSSRYSCRVGRNVIINEDRWRYATRAWNDARRSLRDYRHMVVNHETGHWFGLGHPSCGGAGQLAPVMQQQSKGLQGCRANPWPLDREGRSIRP